LLDESDPEVIVLPAGIVVVNLSIDVNVWPLDVTKAVDEKTEVDGVVRTEVDELVLELVAEVELAELESELLADVVDELDVTLLLMLLLLVGGGGGGVVDDDKEVCEVLEIELLVSVGGSDVELLLALAILRVQKK